MIEIVKTCLFISTDVLRTIKPNDFTIQNKLDAEKNSDNKKTFHSLFLFDLSRNKTDFSTDNTMIVCINSIILHVKASLASIIVLKSLNNKIAA